MDNKDENLSSAAPSSTLPAKVAAELSSLIWEGGSHRTHGSVLRRSVRPSIEGLLREFSPLLFRDAHCNEAKLRILVTQPSNDEHSTISPLTEPRESHGHIATAVNARYHTFSSQSCKLGILGNERGWLAWILGPMRAFGKFFGGEEGGEFFFIPFWIQLTHTHTLTHGKRLIMW